MPHPGEHEAYVNATLASAMHKAFRWMRTVVEAKAKP